MATIDVASNMWKAVSHGGMRQESYTSICAAGANGKALNPQPKALNYNKP